MEIRHRISTAFEPDQLEGCWALDDRSQRDELNEKPVAVVRRIVTCRDKDQKMAQDKNHYD